MRKPRVRIGRLMKGVLVGLALTFFTGLITALWALETGRAVDYVREDLVSQLHDECGLEGSFSSIELGLFPPKIYLKKISVDQPGVGKLASLEQAILQLSDLLRKILGGVKTTSWPLERELEVAGSCSTCT